MSNQALREAAKTLGELIRIIGPSRQEKKAHGLGYKIKRTRKEARAKRSKLLEKWFPPLRLDPVQKMESPEPVVYYMRSRYE